MGNLFSSVVPHLALCSFGNLSTLMLCLQTLKGLWNALGKALECLGEITLSAPD